MTILKSKKTKVTEQAYTAQKRHICGSGESFTKTFDSVRAGTLLQGGNTDLTVLRLFGRAPIHFFSERNLLHHQTFNVLFEIFNITAQLSGRKGTACCNFKWMTKCQASCARCSHQCGYESTLPSTTRLSFVFVLFCGRRGEEFGNSMEFKMIACSGVSILREKIHEIPN